MKNQKNFIEEYKTNLKNSGSYKTTEHGLRQLFLFLRHQECESLWLLNSPKRGKKVCLYKICYPRPKKGKLIIIKKSTSTGKIILK